MEVVMTDQRNEPDRDAEGIDDRPLSHTPGRLEDKETAEAYANRMQQKDTTSLRPRGGRPPEEEHVDGSPAPADAPGVRTRDDSGNRVGELGTAADPLR
jgi:hypothetical protein